MEAIRNRSNYAVIILAALWLASFSGFYPPYRLSALAYEMVPSLKLTPSQCSGIFGAPMIPAVFLSILTGVLADRFGPKKILGAGLVIAATAPLCLRKNRANAFVDDGAGLAGALG